MRLCDGMGKLCAHKLQAGSLSLEIRSYARYDQTQSRMYMETNSNSFSVYKERINKALDFINDHLDGEIHLEDVAKSAFFSSFHFHRIFTSFIGETPDDYIRRLRLEKSARLIQSRKELSITDIAFICGFSTSSLFSRNFRKHFGISPLEWKKSMNRQIISKNEKAESRTKDYDLKRIYKGKLEVEVLKMEAFKIAFVRHLSGYNMEINNAYKKLFAWATPRGLIKENTKIINIPLDNPEVTPEDKCRIHAGISIEADIEPAKEVSIMDIPAGLYARIKFSGNAEAIEDFYTRFFHDWLAYSGYTADDFPIYNIIDNVVFQDKTYFASSFKFDSYIKIKSL
jgi:AraC family transcriptional regulator